MADLKASEGSADVGMGPIGQAVTAFAYDWIVLLSDHEKAKTSSYVRWLECMGKAAIDAIKAPLSSPTHFGEIHEHVVSAVRAFRKSHGDEPRLVFHISPGTPAMAAVWILLSKTRFHAELIESSKDHGVKSVSIPFDISADYIPDLLRKPDEELIRLNQGLPPDAPEFDNIVHRCAPMKRLIARARRVAPRNVPVLILGESGTGKELLARAIHRSSTQREGPFIAVNCGAIPSTLVESELFGHEKGAFTGATAARLGYIEEATHGALFLDEIGELPPFAQVKLLRVLQEKQMYRVGSSKPRSVDFRLIAATNRNLMQDVASGLFREDLFHRIAVAVLAIPPIRERNGDINLLVDTALKRINEEAAGQPGYEPKKLSVSARKLLSIHAWPGNVRELINVLQRAAVWSAGTQIDDHDIREAIIPMLGKAQSDILGRPLGDAFNIQQMLDDVARHYLQRAMEESHGNKTRAAQLLGLSSYQTLSNWLRRYGVDENLA